MFNKVISNDKCKTILMFDAVYTVITAFFLFFLNSLNNILLNEFPDVNNDFFKSFMLLQYNDCEPIKYFIAAIVLILIAAFYVRHLYECIKETHIEKEEVIVAICSVILMLILIAFIIYYIDNPILRAVMVVTLSSYATYIAMSE